MKIKSITDIREFANKVVVAKVGWNRYKGGVMRIHKLPDGFSDGSYGYPVTCAVDENGVHGRASITDKDLELGTVRIRLATQDEIANATPSYKEIWLKIEVGSRVVKKSGKRFANGEKVAVVNGFTTITFPRSNSRYAKGLDEKTEDAVTLEFCKQPIRLNKVALEEQHDGR